MFGQDDKRLMYFRGYLARLETRPKRWAKLWTVPVAAVVTGALGAALSFPPALILVAAVVAGGLAGGWAAKQMRGKLSEREQLFDQAVHSFGQVERRNKLHKELDPTVGQILEAAAFHWTRVATIIDSPLWESAQYQALRTQTRMAADEVMAELVTMGSWCLGTPQKTRKQDLGSVFEDLAELDIDDAIKGFKRIAKTASREYAHQSPYAATVFEPMRQMAEKLKTLADEIEATAEQTRLTTQRTGATEVSSIDMILRELKAVRQAERELDDEQQQNLNG